MSQYIVLKPTEIDKLSAKRKAAVSWEGRLVLPKYDGCFAVFLFEDGKMVRVCSRDNKNVMSMDHLAEDLMYSYPAVSEGRFAFLGEAWIKGKEFGEISGTFRRQRPQPQLQFAPFDLVHWDGDVMHPELFASAPYKERLRWLRPERTTCMIHPPLPITVHSEAAAWKLAKQYKNSPDGYDGAIAADPDAPYVVSDGLGEFLKLKPLQTFTLEVVGIDGGVGERTGRTTASLVVRFKTGRCGVGTGFSNDDAADFVARPHSYLGRFAEVACMGVYPGADGMMREPRFIGWRTDVLQPDY